MNFFTLPVFDQSVTLGDWRAPVARAITDVTDTIVVGIRPEHFTIGSVGVQMQVDVVEELGADAYLYGRIVESGAAAGRPVIARTDGRDPPPRGACLHLRPELDHVHFFGADGRRLS
jgi:multiple sugar transport system ATP-binding protein